MARKIRKDITVKSLEKKLGVAPGTIKNLDGRDARGDKKLETLQKEAARAARKAVAGRTVKKAAAGKKIVKAKAVTDDQKIAAKRTVKSNPKATVKLAKKVGAAIKRTQKSK